MKKWSTINRVAAGKGLLKGCWLVDPDGVKRATIMDEILARQIASAMSLTTPKQRTDYAAEAAGYKLGASLKEEKIEKLTPAVFRALSAVDKGKVVRVYRRDGNSFRAGSGVSSVVLQRVEAGRLIAEGPCTGAVERHCTMVLTRAGEAMMKGAWT